MLFSQLFIHRTDAELTSTAGTKNAFINIDFASATVLFAIVVAWPTWSVQQRFHSSLLEPEE